jgi:hypothetical protein
MARPENQEDEVFFEAEVLRVARALWVSDKPFQGSSMLEGAERDGIFVGTDVVAVVEATVSRRVDKAEKDGDKLKRACERLAKEHPMKAVKGYFVTREEPTAEQRQYIDRLRSGLVACSFAQLRSLLINSREYLSVRDLYPFGSARNLDTGTADDLDEYIAIGLLEAAGPGRMKAHSVTDIADRVSASESTVLLGDFGAGKSMTIREVHNCLASRHRKDAQHPFPVTLNLRDHQGQRDPDEALRRHCQAVGFEEGTKLVRAWRAGRVHILLDGFDEIATSGWLGQAVNLRQIRRNSVELIRKFVDQTPSNVGLFFTGRRHLFDSTTEMNAALGLSTRKPLILSTDEFSEVQVSEYLTSRGWAGSLPNWLPPRPLLLGYLSASGSIEKVIGDGVQVGAAEGWNSLLDKICDREAKIELGLDGGTVRQILERLATLARHRGDGIGPILPSDLADSFEQICGYKPDEGSYVIVQRLPGLGVLDPVDGSRHFVDPALVDAARAGDVVRYTRSSGSETPFASVRGSAVSMGELGLAVAEYLADQAGVTSSLALGMASRLEKEGERAAFVFDIVRLAMLLGPRQAFPSLAFEALQIEQLAFGDIDVDLSALHFDNCLISNLDLTEYDGNYSLPVFSNCVFGTVLGSASLESLPTGHFSDCSFEAFDPSSKTTRGILAMPGLSSRQKVLLTVLKKIYLQAGGGRREGALARGLDAQQKMVVSSVLGVLLSEGLVLRGKSGGNVIYNGVRGVAPRVRRMVEAGASSDDSLLLSLK